MTTASLWRMERLGKTVMRPVNIIVKRPQEEAMLTEVEPTLDNFQALVGGLIQYVPAGAYGLPGGIDVVCNEEGKIFGLTENLVTEFDVLCGTVYFAASELGEPMSLTADQQSIIMEWISTRCLDEKGHRE